MNDITGLPFWQLRFDVEGHVDPATEQACVAGVHQAEVTDLLVFAHGWNNDPATAERLYRSFYSLVPPLLAGRLPAGRTVGLVGVYWPSRRWSDEPVPDFPGPPATDRGAGGGVAEFGPQPTF